MIAELTAPFPYFGAKRHAAGMIWQALGDVASYCEPFAGSLAVLLRRPGGPGRIETINDLSGHVANFWRAVKQQPEEVTRHLDYPVVEQDLHARHRWLLGRHDDLVAGLDADPGKGIHRGQLPHLGDASRPVHSVGGVGGISDWIDMLAERLRRVRVCCGDFRRVVTHSALCDRLVGGRVGIVYDPPYSLVSGGMARTAGLYGEQDSTEVAAACAEEARRQAVEHPTWRIVLCGYEGEHVMPSDWREVAWDPSAGKWGSGGYGRGNGNPQRERLWLSPACLSIAEQSRQLDLVGGAAC